MILYVNRQPMFKTKSVGRMECRSRRPKKRRKQNSTWLSVEALVPVPTDNKPMGPLSYPKLSHTPTVVTSHSRSSQHPYRFFFYFTCYLVRASALHELRGHVSTLLIAYFLLFIIILLDFHVTSCEFRLLNELFCVCWLKEFLDREMSICL